jgi:Raf kinase inhibitor-like YbhB/YbcL family protein
MYFIKKLFITLSLSTLTSVYAAETTHFLLASPVVFNNGTLPARFTCDSTHVSPKLIWQNPPTNTQSFALIVADPDAPAGVFYHWILYNIPKTLSKLDEAVSTLPTGTLLGTNSAGTINYFAPCPPKGPSHHYVFTIYALNSLLNLPAGADANRLLNAMKQHVLMKAEMTVVYGR